MNLHFIEAALNHLKTESVDLKAVLLIKERRVLVCDAAHPHNKMEAEAGSADEDLKLDGTMSGDEPVMSGVCKRLKKLERSRNNKGVAVPTPAVKTVELYRGIVDTKRDNA